MKHPLHITASIGLALGGIFGILGTFVADRSLQSAFWTIDGLGLIVATALLTIKFFRAGEDLLAAGFLIFSIGESVILIGNAGSLEASAPSFAAGTALWSTSLLLTSIPSYFATWV